MGKLALPLVSHAVTYTRKRYPPPSSAFTTCSRQEAWSWDHESRRAGPAPQQLQHSGEWALYLPGQHSRADPDDRNVDELGLCVRMGFVCNVVILEGRDALHLATDGRQESWPQGHQNRRVVPALTLLKHQESRPYTSSGQHIEVA